MTKTLLCTIVVRETKLPFIDDLIQSFTEYTDFDIVVYTDLPLDDIDHDNVIDIREVTDLPLIYGSNCFNYNLKGVVTHYTYHNNPEYDRIVWCDCDVFLTKPSLILNGMNEYDFYGKINTFPPDDDVPVNLKYHKLRKVLGYDNHLDELKYVVEVLMVLNRSEAVDKFLERWYYYCVFTCTQEDYINVAYECVEIALALLDCKDFLTTSNFRNVGIYKEGSLFITHKNEAIPLAQ